MPDTEHDAKAKKSPSSNGTSKIEETSETGETEGGFSTSRSVNTVNYDKIKKMSNNSRPPDTPLKMRLKHKLRQLQSKRWKLEKKVKKLKRKLFHKVAESAMPSSAVDVIVNAAKQFLTPLQLALFHSQLLASQRKEKGYRWSVKEKLFGLQVHFKSAAAYRFVAQHLALPSVSTLRRFVGAAIGRIECGFTPVMFNILKLRVIGLPLCERQCALVFDEISLKSQLTYDKNLDHVIGYTNDGMIATHALVFMIRGLCSKWKQAISFFFTRNTIASSKLSELVKECITRVHDIGLFVRCIVCDQGPTNVAAVKNLGSTVASPNFSIDTIGHIVHVVFDVPHLLKNVRNNLMKHDIEIDGSLASWKHIAEFYRIDQMYPIRLAPRLTERHIDVARVSKMRVSLASQVLSHSVAAGLHMRVLTKELPPEAIQTAAFVDKMDILFDILNSRKRWGDRPARWALCKRNDNLEQLLVFKEWVGKWHFVGARAQSQIKCQQGLQMSISSIHSLACELLDQGFSYVCTSRFNQDCLENFFAGLRGKNGWNENPTPAQFLTAFRSAVVLSSLDCCTSGKNCINDDDFVLLRHSDLSLASPEPVPSTSSAINDELFYSDVEIWSDMSNEILNSDICYDQSIVEMFTEAEESLVSYLSGWLARKCGICSLCQDVLCKRLGDHSYSCRPHDQFIKEKRFSNVSCTGLVEPCDELFQAVHVMEHLFRLHFNQLLSQPHIASTLFKIIHPQCNFQFLFIRHPEHALYISEKLTKLYVVMRLFYAMKFANRNLLQASKATNIAGVCQSSTRRKMKKILHV